MSESSVNMLRYGMLMTDLTVSVLSAYITALLYHIFYYLAIGMLIN